MELIPDDEFREKVEGVSIAAQASGRPLPAMNLTSSTLPASTPAQASGDDFWHRIDAFMDRKMERLCGQIDKVKQDLEQEMSEEAKRMEGLGRRAAGDRDEDSRP